MYDVTSEEDSAARKTTCPRRARDTHQPAREKGVSAYVRDGRNRVPRYRRSHRKAPVPVGAKSHETADHFGCELTRERLRWQPEQPGLLLDLDRSTTVLRDLDDRRAPARQRFGGSTSSIQAAHVFRHQTPIGQILRLLTPVTQFCIVASGGANRRCLRHPTLNVGGVRAKDPPR
jgi:hypothetical protein